ncbi:MAG: hypothetical protein ACRDGS_03640 [Chloroflexota bacterium]
MRQIVAYASLLFMILGAMAFLGGICALFSGLRVFELPLILGGLIASILRWRTAGGAATKV